jgi:uncharacterized protein (DUF1501 family)
MKTSRRDFMIGCSSAIAAMAGSRILNLGWGDALSVGSGSAVDQRQLVVLFLRGGMDGLNFLAPVNDRDYIAARPPDIRLTDSGDSAGLPLGNGPANLDFRLHPQAAPLKELYDSGQLAFVHACGLTDGTRSHFDAMDLMERGAVKDGSKVLSTNGWLSRFLSQMGIANSAILPAASGNPSVPSSLLGCTQAMPVPDPASYHFDGPADQLRALRQLYNGDHPIQVAGRQTLAAFDVFQSKLARKPNGEVLPYTPENHADYGNTDIGHSLCSVARLMKMELGLRVATVDFGGWDTHQNQSGNYNGLVGDLSIALGAFFNDLSRYHNQLNVVVMSEFGRRLKSNQSGGTDHGHGNVMMVMGGGVAGGRIHGTWPGLATEQLDSRADLAVTTDFRAVLAEILMARFGMKDVAGVFPGLGEFKRPGVFAAG